MGHNALTVMDRPTAPGWGGFAGGEWETWRVQRRAGDGVPYKRNAEDGVPYRWGGFAGVGPKLWRVLPGLSGTPAPTVGRLRMRRKCLQKTQGMPPIIRG